MKLSFMLEQARSGELSNLSNAKYTDAVLVSYINLALIALYNKFELATEEAIITLRPDIPKTVYTLDSSDNDVKVGGQPMVDDQFKAIVSAYEENGDEIVVNNEKEPCSIFTVSYNQVQIPLLDSNTYISIIYSCNPQLVMYVDDGTGHAVDTDVKLPLQLLEAALHYIGYRAHGAIDGNVQAENNTHYTRFIMACNEAVKLGILTANDTVMNSVNEKGYV